MSGLVVDTSAIVAIVRREPGSHWLDEQLRVADERTISAPTALELGIVLEGRVTGGDGIARRFLNEASIDIESFGAELADRAMQAWRRFGKGRHPAGLNFGDCCTYALAAQKALPILCVGNDFSQTDLQVLSPPLNLISS